MTSKGSDPCVPSDALTYKFVVTTLQVMHTTVRLFLLIVILSGSYRTTSSEIPEFTLEPSINNKPCFTKPNSVSKSAIS